MNDVNHSSRCSNVWLVSLTATGYGTTIYFRVFVSFCGISKHFDVMTQLAGMRSVVMDGQYFTASVTNLFLKEYRVFEV